nr:hypothetical protein CFP56_15349 [Quercus suber]
MDSTVSIMIDQESCCWREAEIDRLFLPTEANIIKAIPLSFSSRSDVKFWLRNQDGVYSVKSGYKHLTEMEIENGNSPSASNSEVLFVELFAATNSCLSFLDVIQLA